MSFKSRSTKSNYKVTLETPAKWTPDQNNLLAYTLLTFVVVVGLYLLTQNWKGFTAPEEVDLGSVRVIRRGRNRRK